MPAIVRLTDMSTGHGCFPPTSCTSTPVEKTYVNGKKAATVGAEFSSHTCGEVTHPTSARGVSEGSSKTYIEGAKAARIGDDISCGDACGQGSDNTFVA